MDAWSSKVDTLEKRLQEQSIADKVQYTEEVSALEELHKNEKIRLESRITFLREEHDKLQEEHDAQMSMIQEESEFERGASSLWLGSDIQWGLKFARLKEEHLNQSNLYAKTAEEELIKTKK